MRKYIVLGGISMLFLFSACTQKPHIRVEGKVNHAKGQVLYFELFGLNKTEIIDSVRLEKKGQFRFQATLPDAPEFYRLRLGNQFLFLGADSTATVTVETDAESFGENYKVRGLTACEKIKQLSAIQAKTLVGIDSLTGLFDRKLLSDTAYKNQAGRLLNTHRAIAQKIIWEAPQSPAAYFALFQRIHNLFIFDPYNKTGNKCFSAVATAWDTFYPQSARSKNLVNLTLQGLKAIRSQEKRPEIRVREKDKISYFEIKLPNVYDRMVALSSLRGKVVLLDFTAYQARFSPSRNLHFREIYQRFHNRGFEIYQISFDDDENFWKTSASNLPWICVRDRNGLQSEYRTIYNVQELPTFFLLNREGDVVVRDRMISNLGNEIERLL